MLGQYNKAIIWADKALQVDPKHCSSLCTKSNSLRLLKMFKQSMVVIEQSLQINPNHFDSLRAKGESIFLINRYMLKSKEQLLFCNFYFNIKIIEIKSRNIQKLEQGLGYLLMIFILKITYLVFNYEKKLLIMQNKLRL
ncbi:unnamed protein product [Paramecium pentaurelia]|uniref:Uncharacterized protein n=1 Tax=Paramecium pentaurelia TaxID=43138 RepID=A0A8S1SPG8_9CILI|nr:unnamed protein product [Paramecium pentaurelia]